jgi:hypothetical protein
MADDAAAGGGGIGGTLKSKMGPFPVWVWLAIITIAGLAYYLYEQHKQGSAAQQPQGSTAAPEVVVENQEGPYPTGSGGTKKKKHKGKGHVPKPPRPHKKPPREPHQRQITVSHDETLGQLAKQRHWSTRTLHQVEEENVNNPGGEWTPKTELDKGQEVERPLR